MKLFWIIVLCWSMVAVTTGAPLILAEPQMEGEPPLEDIFQINRVPQNNIAKTANSNCPNEEACITPCVFGHVIGPDGCPDCSNCTTSGVVESDILINEKTYAAYLERYGGGCNEKQHRGAQSNRRYEWPRVGDFVEVPYVFDSGLPQSRRNKILEGIQQYHRKTCIRLVERSGQANYINFIGTAGCSSHVGMIGGKQPVSIGEGCDRQIGTILHEIMHALGFWHEQSRGDRDNYVKINWDNIISGASGNFRKQTSGWSSYGSPYDYGSVMHYGGYYFSKKYGSLATIVNLQTNQPVVHQRRGFSEQDLFQINTKYGCTAYLSGSTTQPAASTTTRTTTTTPATTQATTTTTTSECVDTVSNCAHFIQLLGCNDSTIVKSNCRKSCNICPDTSSSTATQTTISTTTTVSVTAKQECVDKNENCNYWANKGYCTEQYVTYMDNNCQKACNKCIGEVTTSTAVTESVCRDSETYASSCEYWVSLNYCTSGEFVSFMKNACKKTCNLCTSPSTAAVSTKVTPTAQACTDNSKHCESWRDSGYCTKDYVEYMQRECRKACGFCGAATTVATITTSSAAFLASTYNGECGTPAVDLQYRIVGGVDALYGASPWIASIRRSKNYDICAASLIDNQHLVTAAHCFGGTKNPTASFYHAFLGKYQKDEDNVDQGQLRVDFEWIRIHDNYNHDTTDHDIAVIRLKRPVKFTQYIRPICLPQANQGPVANTVGLVSGWGDTKDYGKGFNRTLQQVDVLIISNSQCNTWMTQHNGRTNQVTGNMFCAGYENGQKDACQGDSGGPLVQRNGNRHQLQGIVSWGYGCALSRRPGVYTKVASKVGWITSVVSQS